jgi:hypothetical protein
LEDGSTVGFHIIDNVDCGHGRFGLGST